MIANKKRILICVLMAAAVMLSSVSFASAITSSKINGVTYTHPTQYQSNRYRVFHGIDVSVYQGTINWKKVKAAGVDFAFIRCGGTWGRSAFGQYDDSTYSANVSNARSNGVNVGVYYFSLCITEAEAIKEADFAIAKVKAAGLPKGTPIIMDYEFLSDSRLNTAYNKWKKTSLATARKNLTHLANTFLNRVAEEGYTPVFYSYRSLVDWSGRRFNMTAADNKNENLAAFPFWLAQYSKDNSYLDGDGVRMDYWQYTSSGSVSGITGKVDRDFMYYDTQGTGTAAGTKSIRETKITLEATSIKSDGTPKMPKVTVKDGKKTLKENTDYRLSYYNNVANGTATVVIDGLGSYSNSAYKDFALSSDGTAIVQTAAEVEIDPEATPAKVTGVKAVVDGYNQRLTVTWPAVKNANRYRISYKLNGATKWKTLTTTGTTWTSPEYAYQTAVRVRVRAENVQGSESKNGKYSSVLYRYIAHRYAVMNKIDANNVSYTWSNLIESKGTVKYNVMVWTNGANPVNTVSSGSPFKLSVKKGAAYKVRVQPVLTMDGHDFIGTFDCPTVESENLFAREAVIKKLKKQTKTFYYNLAKKPGTGYIIEASLYSDFRTSKKKTIKGSTNKTGVFKKLKGGRKYYVRARAFVDINGERYYGFWSPVKTVKTKK